MIASRSEIAVLHGEGYWGESRDTGRWHWFAPGTPQRKVKPGKRIAACGSAMWLAQVLRSAEPPTVIPDYTCSRCLSKAFGGAR
jgi:hypothetical protein